MEFNTIHIFGFGDVQLIGKEVNKTKKASGLTKLTAFVDWIKSTKPKDVTLTDYHVIHIFNNMNIRYLGKGEEGLVKDVETSWRVEWVDVDLEKLNELVSELSAE